LNQAIPFNCINCHGGIYDRATHRVGQASFLAFADRVGSAHALFLRLEPVA